MDEYYGRTTQIDSYKEAMWVRFGMYEEVRKKEDEAAGEVREDDKAAAGEVMEDDKAATGEVREKEDDLTAEEVMEKEDEEAAAEEVREEFADFAATIRGKSVTSSVCVHGMKTAIELFKEYDAGEKSRYTRCSVLCLGAHSRTLCNDMDPDFGIDSNQERERIGLEAIDSTSPDSCFAHKVWHNYMFFLFIVLIRFPYLFFYLGNSDIR